MLLLGKHLFLRILSILVFIFLHLEELI